jgi:tRNA A-37 threonylcarbamoyl transferase component Bud32
MPCLDDDAIAALLEGALADAARAAAFEHLAACAACRQLVSELGRSLPLPEPEGSAPTLPAVPSPTAPATPRALAAPRAEPAQDPLLGRQLGNFRVTGFIGAGAMGAVYAGEHTLLGHRVAIKVMQLDALGPERRQQAIARFVTEARALTEIKDTAHVIQLHDFGELDERRYYYVMEHLEGHTLEEELERRGALAPEEALPLLEPICAGLEAAHQGRVLHRDLKPTNIFVEQPGGRVKLIDFGLAKRLGSGTATSGGLGSPIYAPPELVLGEQERIGPASDLYSVGAILYRMLCARLPFDLPPEATALELFLLPTRTDPIPLGERRPELPAPITALVDRCLRREPSERPQSARELAQLYAAALAGETIALAPARRAHRPRRRVATALVAATLGLALVAGGVALFRQRGARDPARPETVAERKDPRASDDLLRALGAEVFVSSQLRSKHAAAANLVDGRLDTAWNSRPGDLEGAWLAFRLPASAHVHAILLTVGFTKTEEKGRDLFLMNHRIARVRLLRDGRSLGERRLDIADRGLQRIPIDALGGEYRIEVTAVVPGTRAAWREVCVSELRVPGELPPGQSPRAGASPTVRVGHDPQLAASLIGSEVTAPEAAPRLARKLLGEVGERARRPIASALNTRAVRLERESKLDDALELYLASAELDPSYGLPRYASARLYARKGDREGCLEQLTELKALGRAQTDRLRRALGDEAFATVRDDPRFKALMP